MATESDPQFIGTDEMNRITGEILNDNEHKELDTPAAAKWRDGIRTELDSIPDGVIVLPVNE